MKRIPFLFLLSFLALSGWAWGATYYVSYTSGADTNAGTEVAPWKHHPDSNLATSTSVAKRSTYTDGDIVYLKAGETWWNTRLLTQQAGTATGIITGVWGSGAAPVVSGASPFDGTGVSPWVATGINGEYVIGVISTATPYQAYNGDTKMASGNTGVLTSNSFAVVKTKGTGVSVYVKVPAGDPTGGNVQLGQQTGALRVSHSYRTYRGIDFRGGNDLSAAGVYLTSVNNVHLDACSSSRTNLYNVRFLTVSASSFHDGAVFDGPIYGIFIDTASNNNDIYNNQIYDIWNGQLYGDTAPDGIGVLLWGSAYNNRVYRNVLRRCYVGIKVSETSGTGGDSIYANMVLDTIVDPIYVSTAPSTSATPSIYHNFVLHRPKKGIDGFYHGHGISCQLGSKGASIKNNLVYIPPLSDGPPYATDYASLQFNSTALVDISNNGYYADPSVTAAWKAPVLSGVSDCMTLPQWQAALSGTTFVQSDLGAINANPNFSNSGASIFTLQRSSPARGKGSSGLVTFDYRGRAYHTTQPDMGAFQSKVIGLSRTRGDSRSRTPNQYKP